MNYFFINSLQKRAQVNHLEFKSALINKCIEILEKNSTISREAMDEAQQSANEYGMPKDRYDSFRAQILRKKDLFAEQFQKCQDDILVYRKIDLNVNYEKVVFGAIVITTHHKLFIATGLGKVNFENEDYFVISPRTPLFQTIKNLSKGDLFEFNQGKSKILELF